MRWSWKSAVPLLAQCQCTKSGPSVALAHGSHQLWSLADNSMTSLSSRSCICFGRMFVELYTAAFSYWKWTNKGSCEKKRQKKRIVQLTFSTVKGRKQGECKIYTHCHPKVQHRHSCTVHPLPSHFFPKEYIGNSDIAFSPIFTYLLIYLGGFAMGFIELRRWKLFVSEALHPKYLLIHQRFTYFCTHSP